MLARKLDRNQGGRDLLRSAFRHPLSLNSRLVAIVLPRLTVHLPIHTDLRYLRYPRVRCKRAGRTDIWLGGKPQERKRNEVAKRTSVLAVTNFFLAVSVRRFSSQTEEC